MRRFRTVPALAVALSAPLAAAQSGESGGGPTFTCTRSGWLWQGGVSDDYLLLGNWWNCGSPLAGPISTQPAYFGPVQQSINGVPQMVGFPSGPARLTSDFAASQLTMANGLATHFIIDGATYTCPTGIIGASNTLGLIDSDDATLTLDNAVWDGSLTVAQSAGTIGTLELMNDSMISGSVSIGSGDATIENSGQFMMNFSINNSSAGQAAWINESGSTLELGASLSFSRSWPAQPADLVVEPGATLRKTGAGTSTIAWDFVGNGSIEVMEGALTLSNLLAGSSVATIAPGARLNINGDPAPSASFDLLGEIGLGGVSGGGTLTLSGVYSVAAGGSQVEAEIVNEGSATIISGPNNNSTGSAVWRNTPGSTLEMTNFSSFSRSWPAQPADLIVESGATLRNTGANTSAIGWTVHNAGLIELMEGTLSLNGGYDGLGGQIDVQGGTVTIDGPLSGSTTATIAPGGRLNIWGDPTGSASFDLLGEIGLNGSIFGGGTLTLSGVYTVPVAGGQVEAEIVNEGVATLSSNPNNNSAGSAVWRNAPGSTLELGSFGGFSRSWPMQPADLIVEPGATLRKTGINASSIGWDLTNEGDLINEEGTLTINGMTSYLGGSVMVMDGILNLNGGYNALGGQIDVQGGTVTIDGPMSGSTTATIAPGGRLNIWGDPTGSASFELLGEIGLGGSIFGGGTLTLSGVYTIPVAGGQVEAEIVNEGTATLSSNPNNNSAGSAVWRNAPGSTLEMNNFGGFSRSWPMQPADLIVEPGATLRKTGTGTSSIGWDLTNEGDLINEQGTLTINGMTSYLGGSVLVMDGTLSFSGGYDALGGQIDVQGGTVRIDGPMSGSTTATIDPGGRLDIWGEPTPTASFDLLGEIGLGSSIFGGGTLTLSGVYTIAAAGGQIEAEIVNEGISTLTSSPNNNSTGSAVWRNAPGSTLEVNNFGGFSRSWPMQPADLIVESGATLRKTGTGTSTIGWDITNEGTIDIVEGTLSINNAEPKLKSENSIISGMGRLNLSTPPAFFNAGTIAPTPVNAATDADGLVIVVPFIQNDDTAVFSTEIGTLAGKLTCTGVFQIGGRLDLARFGEFEPDGTEEFVIIEAQFVTGVFGDYFANAVPASGETALDVRTGDLEYDVEYTPTSVVIKNVSVVIPPCSPADLAEASGVLDFNDVVAFLTAFAAADPSADLADPIGTLNFNDVIAYLTIFAAGCP